MITMLGRLDAAIPTLGEQRPFSLNRIAVAVMGTLACILAVPGLHAQTQTWVYDHTDVGIIYLGDYLGRSNYCAPAGTPPSASGPIARFTLPTSQGPSFSRSLDGIIAKNCPNLTNNLTGTYGASFPASFVGDSNGKPAPNSGAITTSFAPDYTASIQSDAYNVKAFTDLVNPRIKGSQQSVEISKAASTN